MFWFVVECFYLFEKTHCLSPNLLDKENRLDYLVGFPLFEVKCINRKTLEIDFSRVFFDLCLACYSLPWSLGRILVAVRIL